MSLSVHRVQHSFPLRLSLQTEPAVEPITTAVAKDHLRVDIADDDTLIDSLIEAARRRCEEYTGRALITQTWDMFLDAWPAAQNLPIWEGTRVGPESLISGSAPGIELPKPPLQSIVHIKTYDDADVDTAFASSNYFVDTATEPGRVVLRAGAAWPSPARVANGIEIQFKAGYGDTVDDIPQDLIRGMLMAIGHWYENREEVVVGVTASEVPAGTLTLWSAKRILAI